MALENFIAHEHGGSTPCMRTEAQGYPHNRACGENVAAGEKEPEKVMAEWKASNGHCRNMMEPSFTHFGAGWAKKSGTTYKYYWTQDFGSWFHAPDQSCIGAPRRRPRLPAALMLTPSTAGTTERRGCAQ